MKSLAVAFAVGLSSLYSIEAVRYCSRLFRWLPHEQQWERATEGRCAVCGYDLTANISGICPECGTKCSRIEKLAPIAPALITEKQPWWVWTAVLMSVAIAVFLQRLLWP